ncbi:MAG: hypothetical protein ACTSSG_11345 [Candidatus Heimdallarchaeaceae archaeon]
MKKEKKEINIIELLEKKGFYEVLYSVAIKNNIRWIDIVYTVQSIKGAFSPTTIRKRLEDLEKTGFIEKKQKQKARDEYTYHATATAKKYAKAIKKMIEETKKAEDTERILIDDPKLANEILNLSIKEGYESPQDFIGSTIKKAYEKMKKEEKKAKR